MDFLKRTTVQRLTPEALRALGPAAETLAKAEKSHAGRFDKAAKDLG